MEDGESEGGPWFLCASVPGYPGVKVFTNDPNSPDIINRFPARGLCQDWTPAALIGDPGTES